MGEATEMMLDGHLNYMGEYTGHNHDFDDRYRPDPSINQVKILVRAFYKWKWDFIYKVIIQYGETLELKNKSCTQICKHICSGIDKTNWNAFKKYIKNYNNEPNIS